VSAAFSSGRGRQGGGQPGRPLAWIEAQRIGRQADGVEPRGAARSRRLGGYVTGRPEDPARGLVEEVLNQDDLAVATELYPPSASTTFRAVGSRQA